MLLRLLPVMERLIDLIHNAKRWADGHTDYLPTLACSSCGNGCVPLCGLGLNRKMTPMEHKDVVLKTRKSMLETGRFAFPMTIQFVSGADIVIAYEKAMDCVEERTIPGKGKQWVFTKPIPTIAGLICKDCAVCVICQAPSRGTNIKHHGQTISVCLYCTDNCKGCNQPKLKHHACCPNLGF